MVEALKRVLSLVGGKKLVVAGFAVACACTYGQERPLVDPAIPLAERMFPPLAPLLEKAVRQSARAIGSNLEFLIARENIGVQRSRMLPSAGGYMTYSYAQDRRLDRADPLNAAKLAYSMVMTQPIFHWGALKAGNDYGKLTAKIAENNYGETCRLLVLELRAAYLRMVVQKAGVKRAQFALRIAETELKQAEGQLKAGAIATAEILTPQRRVRQTQLEFERAEEDYRFSRVTVERLAGVEAIDERSIPTSVAEVPFPKDRLRALAEHFNASETSDGNYRLKIAQLRVDQEKLNYRILDKALRPKFNVVTGVTQDEVSYTGSPADRARTQSLYGGLNVTWNVFDGFLTTTQRRASMLRVRQLEGDLDERQREQSESVRNQMKQIEFAARSTAMAEEMLAEYNLMVAVRQDNVTRGLSAPWEMESVTIARDGVLLQTMLARSDFLGRIADFLSSIGRDPALQTLVPPRS